MTKPTVPVDDVTDTTLAAAGYEVVDLGSVKVKAANPHLDIVGQLATLYKSDPDGYATAKGNARALLIPAGDKHDAELNSAKRQLREAGTAHGVTTKLFPTETPAGTRLAFAVTAKRAPRTPKTDA